MGYFYHGVSDMVDEESLTYFIKILKSGQLKTRQEIYGEKSNFKQDYNHVCLYRKNQDYDYNVPGALLKSARGGWIDGSFVFVISPDIDAEKASSQDTDLVDEWRSCGPISFDKIVAIGIPFKSLLMARIQFPECYSDEYQQKLDFILDFAQNNGWQVVNTDEKDFCDKLDELLDNPRKR